MPKKDKSIAFIVCYIGKLPWYFDYFVHSCSYNPTVDFYIICDDLDFKKPLPANVKLVYLSLSGISELATEKMSLSIKIENPYKLCDFKPAYGLLFEDIVTGYDFWGHGDIDIIFGDIRTFITTDMLDEHDIISVRPDFLTGYFLLFRNTEKMKRLFTLSRDYQKVFSSDIHYCFDETNHEHGAFGDALEAGKPLYEVPSEIDSMTHVVKRLQAEGYLNAYFDLHVVEGFTGKIRWNKGRLFYKNRYEILLYHMILFKKRYSPEGKIKKIPSCFRISANAIYY